MDKFMLLFFSKVSVKWFPIQIKEAKYNIFDDNKHELV